MSGTSPIVPDPAAAHAADLTDEQRFRLWADNPVDVIYRSDSTGVINWVSDSCHEAFGWFPHEMVGRRTVDLIHPDDAVATEEYRRSVRAGMLPSDGVPSAAPPMRVLCASGAWRWVAPTIVPVFEDGQVNGVVGRLRDVHDLINATEAVRATEELTSAAFENLLDPLILMTAVVGEDGSILDFEYLDANRAACEYNGMTHGEMVGSRLLELNPGNVETGQFARLVDVYNSGVPLIIDNYEYPQELRGGEVRSYDLRVARGSDILVYTWRDSTDRRKAEKDLADQADLYRLVTEDVTDAVVRFDETGTVTWVSPSFERLSHIPYEESIGASMLSIIADCDVERVAGIIARRMAGEETGGVTFQMVRADGSVRWVKANARPFVRHDGSSEGFVAVLRDVTSEHDAHLQLEHGVGHDSLTGIANRSLASARIDRGLDELGGSRRFIAVLGIGIDRLTTVNQAMNYAAGDQVITAVAARMSAAVGDPDRVARVAGDEFMVLLTDLVSPAEAASMAERLCAAARGPLNVGGQVLQPTVSIGVVIGNVGATAEDLLSRASLGVRQAKDAGRNCWQFVDPSVAIDAQRRLQIEAELHNVMRDDGIIPWFQPVVTLADRTIRGYEALCRWDGHSSSAPDEFLPVAEATGLIVDIDLTILRKAVDLLAVTNVEHVAVNVSPPSLGSGTYVDGFTSILGSTHVDPTRLRLEVTETALLGESTRISQAMRDIADCGSTWYVDDFGTGFSSISHLRDLPVRGLKLDRSFTAGIRGGDATCIKLAQGLIGLASGLGLDTIAEGIETEFEAGALLGQGWRQGQGWLFGRPEPLVAPPSAAVEVRG